MFATGAFFSSCKHAMLQETQLSDSVPVIKDSLVQNEPVHFPLDLDRHTSVKVLRMCSAFADSVTLAECRDSILGFKVLGELRVKQKYIDILKFLLQEPDFYANDGIFIKSPFVPQYAFSLLNPKKEGEGLTLLYSANQQSFMVVKEDSVQTMVPLRNPRMLENWLKMAVKSKSLTSKRKEK